MLCVYSPTTVSTVSMSGYRLQVLLKFDYDEFMSKFVFLVLLVQR